eukprot:COSAG05_NODE_21070_length_274_cov_1.468571_1_plen_39_part_01
MAQLQFLQSRVPSSANNGTSGGGVGRITIWPETPAGVRA